MELHNESCFVLLNLYENLTKSQFGLGEMLKSY